MNLDAVGAPQLPGAHEIFDMRDLLRCRAFRHTERNIADTGLNLLLEICLSFENSEFATQYYQTYLLQLLQEVFAVMTGGPLLFPFQAVCVDCFRPLRYLSSWPLVLWMPYGKFLSLLTFHQG